MSFHVVFILAVFRLPLLISFWFSPLSFREWVAVVGKQLFDPALHHLQFQEGVVEKSENKKLRELVDSG